MRHYFWHDVDGEIRGQETHDGGFPSDCDPRVQENTHVIADRIRKARLAHPDHGGWVPFDCECPAETRTCRCASHASVNHYIEGGQLVEKPRLTVLVDGVALPAAKGPDTLDRPPGTKMRVVLRAQVPNGHSILVRSSKNVSIIKEPVTVTFQNGETPPVEIVAPSQGMKGWIHGSSKYVRPFGVYVRGWA